MNSLADYTPKPGFVEVSKTHWQALVNKNVCACPVRFFGPAKRFAETWVKDAHTGRLLLVIIDDSHTGASRFFKPAQSERG